MSTNTPLTRANDWARESIGMKLFVIAVLTLLLLIPASFISSLIRERSVRRDEAIGEISSTWGGAQTITGPVLTIPYRSWYTNDKNKVVFTVCYASFLPSSLTVTGTMFPEKRYRGIYEAVLYNTRLALTGAFDKPDFSRWHVSPEDVLWNGAVVSLGISDMRGIRDSIKLRWNDDFLSFEPSAMVASPVTPSLSAALTGPINGTVNFATGIDINGSSRLSIVPAAKVTHVKLSSTWPSPSFGGAFLPEKRTVTGDGFEADWKVLHFNRSFPQQWTGERQDLSASAFGVELLLAVDGYQKTTRAAKYALLFISLTFLTFFLIEVMLRRRVHPVQYLLAGFALCTYYVLLLALTEHVGFVYAYVGAACAVVFLISGYAQAVLRSTRLALLLGTLLTTLYGFLYVVLQLEDHALLVGSLGLFAILAAVMYLTRSIDWYAAGKVAGKS